MRISKTCFALFVFVLSASYGLVAPASAASITAIGGGGAVNNGNPFSGSSVPLSPGIVQTTPNAPPIFGGDLVGGTIVANSGVSVDLTSWSTDPGTISLSPGTFTLTVVSVGNATGIAAGDSVTFTINNPGQGQSGLFGFNLLVPVTLSSVSGFAGHDLTPLNNAFLSITFQVTTATPGNPGQIVVGAGSTYSWTITNQLPVIPEPGTVALFGLGLLGIVGVTLRRRFPTRLSASHS